MEFLNNISKIMLPEMTIIFFIFIQLILSLFLDKKFYKLAKWLNVFGIFIAMSLCTKVQIEPMYIGFKNEIISYSYTIFFKFLILLSSFLIIFLTKKTIASRRDKAFQFHALILTAVLGAMSMVSANDFLTLFISMETLSIAMSFLIAFDNGYKSKEAGFKYLIIGTVASALFLFGVSYIYGITGSINFNEIYNYFIKETPTLMYSLGAVFIVSGLVFKLGVIPFANWIIDVYEGGGTSV